MSDGAPGAPGPLVGLADLADLPGAPFDSRTLAVAGAQVRGACHWHVAPVATTEHWLSGLPGHELVLPTLALVAVESVNDHLGQPISGWRIGGSGLLIRDRGWPIGTHNLKVVLTHGYEQCPLELLAVVREAVRAVRAPEPGVRSTTRTVGAVTTTTAYAEQPSRAWSPAADAVIARYRV